MFSWFWRSDDLGHVSPWNEAIAERHAANTERLLLGACGRSRVVGNRVHEAVIADRDKRMAEARERAKLAAAAERVRQSGGAVASIRRAG